MISSIRARRRCRRSGPALWVSAAWLNRFGAATDTRRTATAKKRAPAGDPRVMSTNPNPLLRLGLLGDRRGTSSSRLRDLRPFLQRLRRSRTCAMAFLTAFGTPLEQHLSDQRNRLGTDDVPYVGAHSPCVRPMVLGRVEPPRNTAGAPNSRVASRMRRSSSAATHSCAPHSQRPASSAPTPRAPSWRHFVRALRHPTLTGGGSIWVR